MMEREDGDGGTGGRGDLRRLWFGDGVVLWQKGGRMNADGKS